MMDEQMILAVSMICTFSIGVLIGYWLTPDTLRSVIRKQRQLNAMITAENRRLRRSNAQYRFHKCKK